MVTARYTTDDFNLRDLPGEFVSNKSRIFSPRVGCKTSWVRHLSSLARSESDSISLPGRLKSPHKMIGCESGIEKKSGGAG